MSSIFLIFFTVVSFMPFSKPSTPNRPEKTAAILEGAMQVFLEQGYAGTTMDRIAVSKPTIYNHFQDKEALFNALVQKLAREKQWTKNLERLQECSEQPPAMALRQFANDIFSCCEESLEQVTFVRLVMGESGRFPELGRALVRYMDKPALDALTQFFKASSLNLADPEATAIVFLGTIIFTITNNVMLHSTDIMPMERDRLVDNLINLIVN
jgi:AcrR family transcriptional regulator